MRIFAAIIILIQGFHIISCREVRKVTKSKVDDVIFGEQEKENLQRTFDTFRHVILLEVKRNPDIRRIKIYLRDDFYYLNNFMVGYNGVPLGIVFSCNDDLDKIHNLIEYSYFSFTLEKGGIKFTPNSDICTIYLPESSRFPNKYPYLDFRYNFNLKKWEFWSIRFERKS